MPLPFDITLRKLDKVHILHSSRLRREIGRKPADAVESFILALYAEGFDVETPAFGRAVNTMVEAAGNHAV